MEFVLPPAWRALLREETEKPYCGFFGSRPFSQVNAFLLSCGFPAIDWKIPEDAQNTALGG